MITNMVNDFATAAERITHLDSNSQMLLLLLVFIGLPAVFGAVLKLVRELRGSAAATDHEECECGDYTYEYPRPSATATIMLVHKPSMEFFVGYRAEDADAYPGYACLPGGFLNAKVEGDRSRPGETIERTAIRETEEETGITIQEKDLILIDVRSDPATDPRAHVVNVCYLAFVDDDQKAEAYAADDLEDYDWRKLDDIERERAYAFDHYQIILRAMRYIAAAKFVDGATLAKEATL